MGEVDDKKRTDSDLRTAYEDGCKFVDINDLKEFLLKRRQLNEVIHGKSDTPDVSGISFDWDKFARDLENKFGESLISAEDADENNPYDYWLQDVTVSDIVEFCKNYR